MAAEVITNVRANAGNRLFYIEAPTGGGKTNMAFIATMEMLQANPELNKVFYRISLYNLGNPNDAISQGNA